VAISRVGLVTLAPGTPVTGWTCAIPAGVQNGDVAYVAISKAANAAPTTVPAGYAPLDAGLPEGVGNNFTWWYGKVLAASDGGTGHVWAWAGAVSTATCLILRGCDTAQPLDQADPPAATLASATTSVATPAATSATNGAWVLWTVSVGNPGTLSFPGTSGGNAVTQESGTDAGSRLGLARAEYPAAGAVASITVTNTASGRLTAKTLIAKPGGGTAPAAPQRWDGGAWVPVASVQRWDGGAWVPATVKRWTGTEWV
jgi:hypothetical protein